MSHTGLWFCRKHENFENIPLNNRANFPLKKNTGVKYIDQKKTKSAVVSTKLAIGNKKPIPMNCGRKGERIGRVKDARTLDRNQRGLMLSHQISEKKMKKQ